MSDSAYCIGVDFGTDSVRSVIVSAADGQEVGSSTYPYPRWAKGLYCNASSNQFRQHPQDYVEGIEHTIRTALTQAGEIVRSGIKAISIATTGSSPVAVNGQGKALALLPEFAEDPDAMFIIWKDHTAIRETSEINAHAKKFETNYLKYVGGIYCSEWYWAKLLHLLRGNKSVRAACASFVEHADWMPFLLTGGSDVSLIKRSVCTAGHKALWAKEWGGFPPDEFFSSLDPLLKGYAASLPSHTYTSDKAAGRISKEWAMRLGLNDDVQIGIGAMDAHMGAVGGQIEPYYLSKVMGTSTCDMLLAPASEMEGKYVQGICGVVNGSIIPGMIGMEAGQSAFGDVYAWFKNILSWPLKNLTDLTGDISPAAMEKLIEKIIPKLGRQAAEVYVDENTELSLDWFNGRRTPDANASVKAGMMGLSLATDAPKIFRSLVEATCFGAKSIVDRFLQQGVPVKGLIGVGGVSRKSAFIMHMMADVLNLPIRISKSEQTSALGAAMFAATVAGVYGSVEEAMKAMGQGFEETIYPDAKKKELYEKRYIQYQAFGKFLEGLMT